MRLLDLFCGRGGWTRPALAMGWTCIGIDAHQHGYTAPLIRATLPISHADIMSLRPDLVVASPPCEGYARHHLPWIRSYGPVDEHLLRWSVNLARTLPVPVVVECSRFAGMHVRPDKFTRPYALWGALPAILPYGFRTKHGKAGSSNLPQAERAARKAEIPPELAIHILEFHARRIQAGPGDTA